MKILLKNYNLADNSWVIYRNRENQIAAKLFLVKQFTCFYFIFFPATTIVLIIIIYGIYYFL